MPRLLGVAPREGGRAAQRRRPRRDRAPSPPPTRGASWRRRAARRCAAPTRCCLSVGRLEAYKGFDDVLRRSAALHAARRAARALGVGGRRAAGRRTARLRRGVAAARLRGPRASAPAAWTSALLHALYARADVFVHATRYEGSSLVTLEAMAHGLPVVATRAGGIPDKVVDGETGLPGRAGRRGRPGRARSRSWLAIPRAARGHGRARAGARVRSAFSWPCSSSARSPSTRSCWREAARDAAPRRVRPSLAAAAGRSSLAASSSPAPTALLAVGACLAAALAVRASPCARWPGSAGGAAARRARACSLAAAAAAHARAVPRRRADASTATGSCTTSTCARWLKDADLDFTNEYTHYGLHRARRPRGAHAHRACGARSSRSGPALVWIPFFAARRGRRRACSARSGGRRRPLRLRARARQRGGPGQPALRLRRRAAHPRPAARGTSAAAPRCSARAARLAGHVPALVHGPAADDVARALRLRRRARASGSGTATGERGAPRGLRCCSAWSLGLAMCLRWQNGVLLAAARRSTSGARSRRAARLARRRAAARPLAAARRARRAPSRRWRPGRRSTACGCCRYPPHGADFLRLDHPVRARDALLLAARPALLDARALGGLPRLPAAPATAAARWPGRCCSPLAGS